MRQLLQHLVAINQRLFDLAGMAAAASGKADPDPLAAFGMTPDELAAALGLDEPDPPPKRRKRPST